MAISEQTRHQLYQRLEATLGDEAAATLMEHLPPVGWADVATKRDLEVLGGSLRNELRADFTERISDQTRTIVLSIVGSNLTMAGLAFAAGSLR